MTHKVRQRIAGMFCGWRVIAAEHEPAHGHDHGLTMLADIAIAVIAGPLYGSLRKPNPVSAISCK
jgi:hypothetical protein